MLASRAQGPGVHPQHHQQHSSLATHSVMFCPWGHLGDLRDSVVDDTGPERGTADLTAVESERVELRSERRAQALGGQVAGREGVATARSAAGNRSGFQLCVAPGPRGVPLQGPDFSLAWKRLHLLEPGPVSVSHGWMWISAYSLSGACSPCGSLAFTS